jgi:hypothetical protein
MPSQVAKTYGPYDSRKEDYTTYVGTRRIKTPVGSYSELLSIPSRERKDDGAVILWAGDFTPLCADCKTGHLQWAEGGYVPWHRICDVCGSHWDLHPVTWGPCKPDERALEQMTRRAADLAGPQEWCEVCDYKGGQDKCPTHRREPIPDPEYVRFVDGAGYVPLNPAEPLGESGKTWGELLALVTPEHWRIAAEPDRVRQMANSVVVPCAWARRARLY